MEEAIKSEAQKIVDKYYSNDSMFMDGRYSTAKQIALVEIKGRLEEVKYDIARVAFLNNVKKEIENL